MRKKVINVDWKLINGAATKKRILRLKRNADGMFLCPISTCLHIGFKSDRGLRKHIDNTHSWYYYFDEQPAINKNEAAQKHSERQKSTTHKIPAFSLTEGLGKEFLFWLSTPCGGGKSKKQGYQIGRRGMKFLMSAMGETEVGKSISEEYIDWCLGTPTIIINFLRLITEEWGLSSSAALNYMKAINDLLDFRKSNGVTDDVLRSFAVSEVYIRRGKENLAKQKKLEYSRNLDLEKLIARDSWATIGEMEEVIPYHTPKYQYVLRQCNGEDSRPSVSELSFATRFIATFLFLRVKCTRPMTYQFITLTMLKSAKGNGGFIDQTAFKTHDTYAFDTLILSSEVMQILETYVTIIRPLLHPTCDYLLLTTNGKQYTAFGSAMSLLVHQSIGKYVHPNRYRQIVESESAQRLTPTEMDAISKDQKHSSYVAKRIYQKRLSRDVAHEGRLCMEKIVGAERDVHTRELASQVCEISESTNDCKQVAGECDDTHVNISDKEEEQPCNGHSSVDACDDVITANVETQLTDETPTASDDIAITSCTFNAYDVINSDDGVNLQNSLKEKECNTTITHPILDVEVKKEEADKQVAHSMSSKRFTLEEDSFLKKGVQKHGLSSWSHIVRDKEYSFHPSRTRDSLRMRAKTLGISKKKKGTRKEIDIR